MKEKLVIAFKMVKWGIKMILAFTGIVSLPKCSSGYSEKDGKINFNGKEITDKHFIVLSNEFAKDSAAVYYKEKAFQYADVASFEVVDEHYAKDKNKVYYCDEYRDGQNYYLTKHQVIKELRLAHPASFISIRYGYAKDNGHAYFEGMPFAVNDVLSFTVIDNHFSKDDVRAYLNCKPIAGSHGRTFRLEGDHIAKDTAHVYYYGYTGDGQNNIAVIPCDRQSFTILDDHYSKDKNSVFFLAFTMQDVDAATFSILPAGYSKDNGAVYFESKKMADVNSSSFEVYKENDSVGHDVVYARDNASVFMNDKKVTGANVSTFKVLGENYGSDGNHVFYKTKIVNGASPASFTVYPHDVGNADAEDATAKFHKGVKVQEE